MLPAFRRTFGLSVVQVGLLEQVLGWVGLGVEVPGDLLIDVASRRALLTWGATCTALAVLLMGVAPGFPLLLAGFALYGLGSGPLTHTGDVVVIEQLAHAPDRAIAQTTLLDEGGALLAPAAIAVASFAGLSWRVPLLVLAAAALVYAFLVARTPFPSRRGAGQISVRALARRVRAVAGDRRVWPWLLFLAALDLIEANGAVTLLWLHERVGLSQAGLSLYVVGEGVAALVGLAFLERWLAASRSWVGPVIVATALNAALYPVWIMTPAVGPRLLLGLPLEAAYAVYWPVARGRSLAAASGTEGALTAITSALAALPLALVVAVVADRVGYVPVLMATTLIGLALIAVATAWARRTA